MLLEQFKFDNYSLRTGIHGKQTEWFAWKVFISKDEPDEKLDKVKSVEYRLPESFPNPIRHVENRESRFSLNSSGGGEFPIFITIFLIDNSEISAKYRLDLKKCWPPEELKGIHLDSVDLENANLEKANLRSAILRSVNLNGANLNDADLTDAKLVRAKLYRTNLKGATLTGANLSYAEMWYSDLTNANLQKADFSQAQLYNANLIDANMEEIILFNAGLMGAHLEGACLKNADLRSATLKDSKFNAKTNCEGAQVDDTTINNLNGSNWSDAKWDSWTRDKIIEELKRINRVKNP